MIAPTLLATLATPTAGGVSIAAPGAGDLFAALVDDGAPASGATAALAKPPAVTPATRGQNIAAAGVALPVLATSASSIGTAPLDTSLAAMVDGEAPAPAPNAPPSPVTTPFLASPFVIRPPAATSPIGARRPAVVAATPRPTVTPALIVNSPDAETETDTADADGDGTRDGGPLTITTAAPASVPMTMMMTMPLPVVVAPTDPVDSAGSTTSTAASPIVASSTAIPAVAAFTAPIMATPDGIDTAALVAAAQPTPVASKPPVVGSPTTAAAANQIASASAPASPSGLPVESQAPPVGATPAPSILSAPTAVAPQPAAPPSSTAGAPFPAATPSTPESRVVTGDGARPSSPAPSPAAPMMLAATSAAIVPAIGVTAPARQLFAAAIDAVDRQQRAADQPADPAAGLAATPLAPPLHAVTAAVSAEGQQSLDMRHDGWPSAMVDHIERLRDAADATDTRIRLVPDALGGINVAISRQADGVHVALHADQAATRALLAEAQPQLADLASARGLKLADAPNGFGAGGDTGGFAGQQRQPASRAAPQPAPAIDPITDDADPADDGRIA